MAIEAELLRDPEFRQLLAQRSRWRWGLSCSLIGIYFLYCLAGIYFSDAFARPALGTSISWSIAMGYLIIAFAIALSLLYIRVVGRILEKQGSGESGR
jgi:uncharacterized membrane protein (DUF485 family)